MTLVEDIIVKRFGIMDYVSSLEEMRAFTSIRDEATPDEIWLLEHPPVYTLGQAARVPAVANGIPLVQSDRGGEITYHGPGQAVIYTLVDLAPFAAIDPCGTPGLAVTQMKDLGFTESLDVLGTRLAGIIVKKLDDA